MKAYLDLVDNVLNNGIKKTNRTGIDTIMYFGYHYKVNLAKGFPLLTTKKVGCVGNSGKFNKNYGYQEKSPES